MKDWVKNDNDTYTYSSPDFLGMAWSNLQGKWSVQMSRVSDNGIAYKGGGFDTAEAAIAAGNHHITK